MELTILGVRSPYPQAGRATVGYLLEQAGTGLLLDAGFGIYRRLSEEGLFPRLDGILLSHLHYDHCADLPAIILGATVDQGREGKIPVFLPPGESERLNNWLTTCAFTFVLDFVNPVELPFGVTTTFGELRVTLHQGQHSLPSAITTAVGGDRRLVYTGDTGDCPALRTALAGADLALAEVSVLSPSEAAAKGHLSPSGLGEIARGSAVRRLVLTHFMRGIDPEALAREVESAYGRPPEIAQEGLRITV